MDYKVIVTSQALNDLFEIYKYVFLNYCVNKADNLISELRLKCFSLDKLPKHGHTLPEIKHLNNTYRQIHYKSYRIIYKITERVVYVNSVLDGRRELIELLHERILR